MNCWAMSDGEPGQTYQLQNAPVLALREGETVTVDEKRDGELVPIPWTEVREFSNSDRFDRHFTLDTATGEVTFGPRHPAGGWLGAAVWPHPRGGARNPLYQLPPRRRRGGQCAGRQDQP